MYDYRPPRRNVLARLLVLGLSLLAIIFFVISAQLPALAVLFQTLALILLLPIIQLITRYIVLRHLYRLRSYESGEADLEIYTYRGGDRMQLVCRVGLEEITAVTPLGNANRRPAKGMRRYNYSPDIRPAEATVLSVTNGDGDCEILLCPNEKMLEILQAALQKQ